VNVIEKSDVKYIESDELIFTVSHIFVNTLKVSTQDIYMYCVHDR